MYELKRIPQDFLVKEIKQLKTQELGEYCYYLLKKKDTNHFDVISKLAKFLHIPEKHIGYAGIKDRTAVTQQYISIKITDEKKIDNFSLENAELEFIGKGKEPISLGELEGNEFEIIVRNLDQEPKEKNNYINYFGEQRFSKKNVEIGRALIKKDFKTAAELLDYRQAEVFLKNNPDNFLGAFQKLPKKLIMLFLHAYQSFIWNKTAEEYVKLNGANDIKIPLVGFGYEESDEKVDNLINKLLKEEKITPRDFIIKQLQGLSAEGAERNLLLGVKNLEIGKLEEDELNPGKKKINLKFFLPKGSYATEFVKQILT
ncbi:tRNA pseudouridine(13) synthase TruD [Nanoarchaeota archaeon]